MVKQSTSEGAAVPVAAPAPVSYNQPIASAPVTPRSPLKWIRPVQLVFAIIILGLTAFLSSITYCNYGIYVRYCSRVNFPQISFMLFNAVWTLIITIYFIVATYKTHLYNPIASTVLDALSVVFWFSGWIALAVLVGYYSTIYGDDSSARFGVLIAVVIFGIVEWILFMTAVILNALTLKASHANGQLGATPMQQYPNQGVSQGVAQHA